MNSVHLCAGTYNVTAVKLGLDITMLRNSGAGPYNITLRTSSGDTLSITSDVNESLVSIRNLKPCTEYTTYVYFIGNGSGAPCQQTGDAIRTNGMGECTSKTPHTTQTHRGRCCRCEDGDSFWAQCVCVPAESDVEDMENPGAVCFRSAWDISSSANVTLTALSLSPDDLQRTYCFMPQFHQICRALSVSFSSGNCSLSFARTKNITASGRSLCLSSLIFCHPLHFCVLLSRADVTSFAVNVCVLSVPQSF